MPVHDGITHHYVPPGLAPLDPGQLNAMKHAMTPSGVSLADDVLIEIRTNFRAGRHSSVFLDTRIAIVTVTTFLETDPQAEVVA